MRQEHEVYIELHDDVDPDKDDTDIVCECIGEITLPVDNDGNPLHGKFQFEIDGVIYKPQL